MSRPAEFRPRAGVEVARLRATMLERARRYFAAAGVLEVDTPALSPAAVSDPNVESVTARLSLAPGRDFYLQTSPEFPMKRLLAAGFPDIYALCRVFRDGECGHRHQPEFTMVEWYRRGFDLEGIIDDTLALFAAIRGDGWPADRPALRLTYGDAFRRFAGVDPAASAVAALADAAGADAGLRRALGRDRDAWLDLVMATAVSAAFPTDRLTVVYHYPASQAALARLAPGNDEVAERFEVFQGAVELANGYVELTDAGEQRARIAAEQRKRAEQGRPVRPVDERLLAALDAGLPSCAGVAAGFDRLLMLAAGADDIRDVQHFPFEESA